MHNTFRPLQNRVLVKQHGAEEKTPSGIIIPDTAKNKPNKGEVVAVGKDAQDVLSVGNIVLFSKSCSSVVKIDGEEYLVIKDDDVIAIV